MVKKRQGERGTSDTGNAERTGLRWKGKAKRKNSLSVSLPVNSEQLEKRNDISSESSKYSPLKKLNILCKFFFKLLLF